MKISNLILILVLAALAGCAINAQVRVAAVMDPKGTIAEKTGGIPDVMGVDVGPPPPVVIVDGTLVSGGVLPEAEAKENSVE